MHPCTSFKNNNQLESDTFHGSARTATRVLDDSNVDTLGRENKDFFDNVIDDNLSKNIVPHNRVNIPSSCYKILHGMSDRFRKNIDGLHFRYLRGNMDYKHSIYYLNLNRIDFVDQKFFKDFCNGKINDEHFKHKFYNYKGFRMVLLYEKTYRLTKDLQRDIRHVKTFKPEIGIEQVREAFDFASQSVNMTCKGVQKKMTQVADSFSFLYGIKGVLMNKLHSLRSSTSPFFTKDFMILIFDIFNLMLTIRDQYLTFNKFFIVLLNMYTMYHRCSKIFMPQVIGVEDILVGFSLLGMPREVITLIKDFVSLTGKRIFSADSVLNLLSNFCHIILGILDFFGSSKIIPETALSMIRNFVDVIFSNVNNYTYIRDVTSVYVKYVQNSSIILDPLYRDKAQKLYKQCVATEYFLEYVHNSNNKHFSVTWNAFENLVVKSIMNFDKSSRKEPICIVLQGPPGSGKSTIMNNFVNLLRQANYSVYVHTTPSIMDNKDFYDDYDNQDVFVMDDVGQQGPSQWRSIINFVSPVKYPLPCAAANLKNTKFFNSKVIVCSTNNLNNLSFTSSDCISEPEALYRRIHLITVNSNLSNGNNAFKMNLQYSKYDHLKRRCWENKFLFHNAIDEKLLPTSISNVSSEQALGWLWKIYNHVDNTNSMNVEEMNIGESALRRILEEDIYYDAQASIMHHLYNVIDFGVCREFFDEWISYFVVTTASFIFSVFDKLNIVNTVLNIFSMDDSALLSCGEITIGVLFAFVVMYTMYRLITEHVFTSNEEDSFVDIKNYLEKEAEKCDNATYNTFARRKKNFKNHVYHTQAGVQQRSVHEHENNINQRIEAVKKKNMRMVMLKKNNTLNACQALVTGKYIILPAHVDMHNEYIDVYATYDHYKNKHKELENVKLELHHIFIGCDIAIYRMCDIVLTYRKLLLKNTNIGNNPKLYFVNAMCTIPVCLGVNVYPNDDVVKYNAYIRQEGLNHNIDAEKVEIKHDAGTGYITPFTKNGLCGSILMSEEMGIVGFHVAGNGDCGFVANIPDYVADVVDGLQVSDVKYDIHETVMPNKSGVRLRYDEGTITPAYPLDKTSFVPTLLHRDNCIEIRELEKNVVVDRDLVSVDTDCVKIKKPPIFKKENLSLSKSLKEQMMKTFSHQGDLLSKQEVSFVQSCIDSIIPEFGDITFEEAIFGGEKCTALNKDSSNGYGCRPRKEDYFDYNGKKISSEAYDLLEKFRIAAYNKDFSDFSLFLCKETFKDELRAENKVCDPRTFRVLPLPHILWTKRIFAELAFLVKKDMFKTGLGIGFNPYKDFHIIYEQIRDKEVCDADFSKWDGSLPSQMFDIIKNVILRKYRGEFGYVVDYLFTTMSHSVVLCADELYATTHGLPSGTWLTLLLNCLINKCITALTLYRSGSRDPEDFLRVVDYVTGDDKLFAADSSLIDKFNLFTVQKVASTLGMSCTNGDKTPIVKRSQCIAKIMYLKRHFRYHSVLKRVVGVLSLDTIFNTLQWYDKHKDLGEVMQGKMLAVQVESYLHSPALYSRFTGIFRKYYPFTPLFTEEQVLGILEDEEGYKRVQKMLGKDVSYLY